MHVLIGVQASLHQGAGLAAAGEIGSNTCGFFGIGGRDNLIRRHINLALCGNLADLLFRSNQQRRNEPSLGCLDRADQRVLAAGIDDGGRQGGLTLATGKHLFVTNFHVGHCGNSCAPNSRDTAECISVELCQAAPEGSDLSFGSPNKVSTRARRRLLSCASAPSELATCRITPSREFRSPRPAGSNIGIAAVARSGSCIRIRNCSFIISLKRARLMRSVSGSSELIPFSIPNLRSSKLCCGCRT